MAYSFASAGRVARPPGYRPAMSANQAGDQSMGMQGQTAQAAQQMGQGPYSGVPQSMMNQGAQMASSMQSLGQLGEMQRMGADQMNRQSELARAAAMRNTRTPPGMMGQIGTLQTAAPAVNPYAGMLQSMGAASQARGWGVDPRSGQFFVNQSAAQSPDNQAQWAQMMRGLQSYGGR